MWIKLHLFQSGDEVAVQTQNICAVYPDQRKQYKGATAIQFNGAEENYIQVKESVDEIGAIINERVEQFKRMIGRKSSDNE